MNHCDFYKELKSIKKLGDISKQIQILNEHIEYLSNPVNVTEILLYDRTLLFNYYENRLRYDFINERLRERHDRNNKHICEMGNNHLKEYDENYNINSNEFLTNPYDDISTDSDE